MRTEPLKTALLANALFSLMSGVTSIVFGRFLSTFVGVGAPIVYQVIGVSLVMFALLVALTALQQPLNTLMAAVISLADLLWVVGTFLLIIMAYAALQPVGILLLLGVAIIVLCLALGQLQGINMAYTADNSNSHKLCVAISTPASAAAMWSIIADLPSIRRYSPNLSKVILRDGATSGVGAVRECTDVNGKTWGERCKLYDDQTKQVAFDFLADEAGFPYPFKTMSGGWHVTPDGTGSVVTVWFEVTPKHRLLQPIILALTAGKLESSFGAMVARMTAAANGESASEVTTAQNVKSGLVAC